MARLHIIKTTADGEQVSIEEDIPAEALTSGTDLLKELRPYFKLMDDRLWEMNKRIFAGNYLMKKLPPEAQMTIHNLEDVLHGHKPGPSIELIIQEATEELSRQREEAELAAQTLEDAKQPSDA